LAEKGPTAEAIGALRCALRYAVPLKNPYVDVTYRSRLAVLLAWTGDWEEASTELAEMAGELSEEGREMVALAQALVALAQCAAEEVHARITALRAQGADGLDLRVVQRLLAERDWPIP